VRYLSIEPSPRGWEKRLQAHEAKATTRLPAGRAVAGIFDADGSVIALTRPFTTSADKPTLVTPRVPDGSADLMVVLGKQKASPAERTRKITAISTMIAGKEHYPAVLYEHNGRIIAIWYGLPSGTARLKLSSDLFRIEQAEIQLATGTVTTFRETLDLETKGGAP